jgi:hypothetical protein
MSRLFHIALLVLVFLAFPFISVCAQTTKPVQEIYLTWKPDSNPTRNNTFLQVTFAGPLSRVLKRDEITVTAKPSGTLIRVSATDDPILQPTNHAILFVYLEKAVAPSLDDTEVEVRFNQVPFKTAPITSPVTATGKIYGRSNIKDLVDLQRKRAQDAVANSKTKDERNIFAVFSALVPADGDAQADADIVLNQRFGQNFFSSLIFKKSTAEGADPKHFNLALGYRKVFSTQGKQLRKIINMTAAANNTDAEIVNEINALSNGFLLNFLIDAAGRLEGEAMNFNVTNAIFDIPLQLASRTKKIGGRAFFNFRVIPAGVELGRNLRNENEAVEKYYIGRFKFGGELNFYYDPIDKETAFPKRIEFNLQGVNRYLWRDETAFDEATMMSTSIAKGHKSWVQGDLYVFLGETQQGRFGFKVSGLRGKLPPTFADTKALTFGLVFQSADDKSNQ